MITVPHGATSLPETFETWLFKRTLPFWAVHGWDGEAGGFHERLDRDRQPVTAEGKRAMVQARQIYVFAQSALLERLPEGAALAQAGRDFLLQHYRHPDGGWRFRVTRDGAPLDDTRDLYTQAFVIFALAWLYRLDKDDTARTLADETAAFLDKSMAHPRGGYRETIGSAGETAETGPRRQNPHMHLFEACLDWYDVTTDTAWLERANGLLSLFEQRFCVDGTLRELFDDDLAPLPGPDGRIVEPGHHYEWVWLLHRYESLTGDGRLNGIAERLYTFAATHGNDPGSGGIIDCIAPDGAPLKKSRRLWPQTEAIKAHIARCEAAKNDETTGRLSRQIEVLYTTHLSELPDGVWREHLREDGTDIVDTLPASSLYHLTLAAAELTHFRAR